MSILDCVNKLRSEEAITEKQGKDILKKYTRLKNMYTLSGKYSESDISSKAAIDSINNMLRDVRFAKYQEALAVEKIVERRASIDLNAETRNNWEGFGGKKKGVDRAMVDELLRTENAGNAIDGQAVSKMYEFVEKFRSKVGGGIDKTRLFGGKNNDLIRQVVRVLHGDQGSKEAKYFADMYKQGSDFIFDRKLRAGININKLENFGIPHKWDSNMLKRAGKQAFINDAMKRLDRTRMVAPDGTGLDDGNLSVVLSNVYNKLTGGPTQALPLDGEFLSRGSGMSLRSSTESSRILHFKSGADWLEMHDMYGTGDIFSNMLQEINRSAQDIAIFERFGPNPQKVFNSLQAEAKIKNQIAIERGEKPVRKTLAGTPEQMWKVLTGTESELVNPRVADVMAGLRNFQSSAKLGSAVLSNLTDQAFAMQQLNRWGGSYLRYVHRWFGQLRPGNIENRKMAAEMLLGLKWAYNGVTAANRFGDVDAIGRFSRIAKAAADFTIRTSGLSTLNRASRSAAGLELNATIARNYKSSWDNLDPRIKLGLKDREITSQDWDIIRSTTLTTTGGARYIDMQRLLEKSTDVSTKFAAIMHEFIRKAAPEPDLQARSVVTGGGAAKGSLAREATATFLQFKTFPITVMLQTLRDQMFDPRLAVRTTRIADAAKLAIYASIIGGGVVQLNHIVNGRDFEDPYTLAFFFKSIAQGGSLGVLADAVRLSSETSRARVAEQLLPPAAGLAVDITTNLAGAGSAAIDEDYDKIAKSVINTINNQTPGRTFYTKLAIERLIYDQMEDLIRPDSYKDWRRYQRSLNKRTGQGLWWQQGELVPDRLPRRSEQP